MKKVVEMFLYILAFVLFGLGIGLRPTLGKIAAAFWFAGIAVAMIGLGIGGKDGFSET